MVVWDPALIVCLLGQSSSGNGWAISSNNGNLVFDINGRLGALRRSLGALSSLSATAGLWEQRLDPGLVNEVESTNETSEKEEIEEDTVTLLACNL